MRSRLAAAVGLWVVLVAATVLSTLAQAHDTWFEPVGSAAATTAASGSSTALALGTGARFPHMQTRISPTGVALQGCWVVQAESSSPLVSPMKVLREEAQALVLQVPFGASSCWVQTVSSEIELKPSLVAEYLDEIKASPRVRARWQALQAQGLPWREHFSKDARIDLAAAPGWPLARPSEHQALDWLRQSGEAVAGQVLRVQVLQAGRALAGQAVQAVSGSPHAAQAGFWLQTDEQGLLQLRLPLAGPWLLRTTALTPDPQRPNAWISRFSTLRLEAAPSDPAAPAKPGYTKP